MQTPLNLQCLTPDWPFKLILGKSLAIQLVKSGPFFCLPTAIPRLSFMRIDISRRSCSRYKGISLIWISRSILYSPSCIDRLYKYIERQYIKMGSISISCARWLSVCRRSCNRSSRTIYPWWATTDSSFHARVKDLHLIRRFFFVHVHKSPNNNI